MGAPTPNRLFIFKLSNAADKSKILSEGPYYIADQGTSTVCSRMAVELRPGERSPYQNSSLA